jgi:hypothetical protein
LDGNRLAEHVTHPSIIFHLYFNFSHYREVWSRKLDETQAFGAFVFLPEKDLEWEWWTVQEIRNYIRRGGLNDEELLGGLRDFDFGEEFLVLVIEHVGGPRTQKLHLHRMNNFWVN